MKRFTLPVEPDMAGAHPALHRKNARTGAFLACFLSFFAVWTAFPGWNASAAPAGQGLISPSAVVVSPDGKRLYVAGWTDPGVQIVEAGGGKVLGRIPLPQPASGLAISGDGRSLYVTCAGPRSQVCVIDTGKRKIVEELEAGHTAMAPVLSPDGERLYVCNRFNDEVTVIALSREKKQTRIPVTREPVAAALTPDGELLFVANHLHQTAATESRVAATVSVIDTGSLKVVKELALPNGSGLLLGAATSPDGRFAAVTHNVARYQLPTTQLDRGWVNTAALTLIDVARLKVINTVLLDSVDRGAANPWAVSWTGDGKHLLVTHAGTHELSVIDSPGLLRKLKEMPARLPPGAQSDYTRASNVARDVPNDLAFLMDLRTRVKLTGMGPRALATAKNRVWVANYFSDTLDRLDLGDETALGEAIPLSEGVEMTAAQRGEMLFNDASICFQNWQSCASCHSYDGRVDALNWDLLNDGIGNPKNAKSLLLTFDTPPSMSLGVRATPEDAVRAGIRHILFSVQPDEVAESLDAFVKSLESTPSPHLVKGDLSEKAFRGKQLFEDPLVGCVNCHSNGAFTNLNSYDVGTGGTLDRGHNTFDTPTLVEVWRTAPYLHDGSAVTIRDVMTTRNPENRHGRTEHLTEEELEALEAYVLSL